LRRPAEERTAANKRKAISHASYHSLLYVYPEDKAYLDEQMKLLGYDSRIVSKDPRTPEGVGHLAAQAVIDYRRHDGANQHGDEPGGDGTPYSDYTYYRPVNPVDKILDPDRWQPIEFTLPDGRKVTPGFLTPHWYRVKPFVLESADQFRPEPPPLTTTDDPELRRQTALVLKYNNSLTDEEKAAVEFMRDGPRLGVHHAVRLLRPVRRRPRRSV
jgi:hypothetical protein